MQKSKKKQVHIYLCIHYAYLLSDCTCQGCIFHLESGFICELLLEEKIFLNENYFIREDSNQPYSDSNIVDCCSLNELHYPKKSQGFYFIFYYFHYFLRILVQLLNFAITMQQLFFVFQVLITPNLLFLILQELFSLLLLITLFTFGFLTNVILLLIAFITPFEVIIISFLLTITFLSLLSVIQLTKQNTQRVSFFDHLLLH